MTAHLQAPRALLGTVVAATAALLGGCGAAVVAPAPEMSAADHRAQAAADEARAAEILDDLTGVYVVERGGRLLGLSFDAYDISRSTSRFHRARRLRRAALAHREVASRLDELASREAPEPRLDTRAVDGALALGGDDAQ